jgi:hypothetical protein
MPVASGAFSINEHTFKTAASAAGSPQGGDTVAPTSSASAGTPDKAAGLTSLGFLTVLSEASGYVGGYLVTNMWGRPLEFRLSSAVQPNRVQQILYGGTLQPYVCADLIGKTLVDKAGVAVQLVVTDREAVRDLRLKLEVPVLWLAPADEPRAAAGAALSPPGAGRNPLLCHPRYPGDVALARELLARLDAGFDLAEPFTRIREAIGEARKMGVTGLRG